MYANSALDYLKSRSVYFPYLVRSSPSRSPASIRLPTSFVVPLRSNLMVDGLSNTRRDKERTSYFMLAMKTYAFISTACGGLHLVAWNFEFFTPVEMWFRRASGLCMITAPTASLITQVAMMADVWLARTRRQLRKSSARMYKDLSGANQPDCRAHRSVHAVWLRMFAKLATIAVETIPCIYFAIALVCWALYPVARIYVLGVFRCPQGTGERSLPGR